jgi:hypothetical protein
MSHKNSLCQKIISCLSIHPSAFISHSGLYLGFLSERNRPGFMSWINVLSVSPMIKIQVHFVQIVISVPDFKLLQYAHVQFFQVSNGAQI